MNNNKNKPDLSFWQIWNMCFGFLGIQFGFALQNGNVSRIFQTLGANVDDIPILWVAAPLTGLIVQPIIGYWSDKTWGKLGRRRPFFLYGAILTTLSLFIMPNSPTLWIAAGMLWIMDASINTNKNGVIFVDAATSRREGFPSGRTNLHESHRDAKTTPQDLNDEEYNNNFLSVEGRNSFDPLVGLGQQYV